MIMPLGRQMTMMIMVVMMKLMMIVIIITRRHFERLCPEPYTLSH